MNKLLTICLCLALCFTAQSQIIPKGETRIAVNKYGDTMLIMHLGDAKMILADLLDKKLVDSIVSYYQAKDTSYMYTIALYTKQIQKLQEKSDNQDLQIEALQMVISNQDKEINKLNETVKIQKKEIKKQRRSKSLALSAAVILPLAVLIMKL